MNTTEPAALPSARLVSTYTTRYDFQRLTVYSNAMNFAEQVFKTTARFPATTQNSLGDQFRRASLSVCNNIAEGSQQRGASRRRFYQYSLHSARECVPMIELCERLGFFSKVETAELSNKCYELCKMLYRLMESSSTGSTPKPQAFPTR